MYICSDVVVASVLEKLANMTIFFIPFVICSECSKCSAFFSEQPTTTKKIRCFNSNGLKFIINYLLSLEN